MKVVKRIQLLLAPIFAACASGPEDLALPEDWVVIAPEEDPVEGNPLTEPCPPRAAVVEAGALELDTVDCPWITVRAESRARVRPGQEIELLLIHTALSATEPAEAVLQLYLNDTDSPVWEKRLPVPSPNGFYAETVQLSDKLRAGEPIYFHVHNHGANNYTIGHLRRL